MTDFAGERAPTIILVEACADHRRAHRRSLATAGCQVLAVADVEEAIEVLCESYVCECVLLVDVPRAGADELRGRIEAFPAFRTTSIVAMALADANACMQVPRRSPEHHAAA